MICPLAFLLSPDHVPIPESVVSNIAILEKNKALQGRASAHEVLKKLHLASGERKSDEDQRLHVRVALCRARR